MKNTDTVHTTVSREKLYGRESFLSFIAVSYAEKYMASPTHENERHPPSSSTRPRPALGDPCDTNM